MKNRLYLLLILTGLLACSAPEQEEATSASTVEPQPEAISFLGDSLYAADPSEALLEKWAARKQAYEADTTDVETLIWYGRFIAYKGQYQEAIALYSDGIQRFPNDPRLYRHRGHRYISTRQLDKAIADYEKAVTMIEGTPNEIEPDGMPNAQNIPVSTLHGNIWYHLGLAYYLNGDFPNALRAYTQCLASTNNDDNVVSATHWLYMINRRMGDTEAAEAVLAPIQTEMGVIENFDYQRACLFYKGELPEEQLIETGESTAASDAVKYALANWHYYEGDTTLAVQQFQQLLDEGSWNSFGYIAAEADLAQQR